MSGRRRSPEPRAAVVCVGCGAILDGIPAGMTYEQECSLFEWLHRHSGGDHRIHVGPAMAPSKPANRGRRVPGKGPPGVTKTAGGSSEPGGDR